MAASETARLIASLELKDLFTKQVDNATKSLGKLDKGIDSTQGRAYKAGTQIGTGIKRGLAIGIGAVGFLATNVALGVRSLEGLEKVTAQTNAVIKSTKGVAGESAQAIRDLAQKYEGLNATIDDTVIQSGANLLLTFTNIRKQAFEPALRAALNLSTAMDQDLKSSVVQIGKALNDPIKGITALTRVGVTFTEKQKDQIKSLIKQNDLYGAQQIIIKELDREFGGSFLGQGNTTAGKFAKVRDAVDDLQRALATALLPALSKIADAVSKTLTDPSVVKGVENLGQQIAGLFSDQNLASAAGAVQGFIKTAAAAAPILEASAKATLGFVQAAVGVFNTLPDPLKAVIAGGFALNKLTGGLVTNIGGALIDLVGKSRGASPANPVFVSDVSGGIGGTVGKVGGLAGGIGLSSLVAGFSIALAPVVAGLGILALNGDEKIKQDDKNARELIAAARGLNPANVAPGIQAGGPRANALQPGQDVRNFGGAVPVKIDPEQLNQITPNAILDRGGREQGFNVLAGKMRDDANFIADTIRAIGERERGAIEDLKHSSDPKKIADALKAVQEIMIAGGHGSVKATLETARAIREQLRHTHDPTLQAALRSALKAVEGKIPGREYAQRQIAKADSILHSGRSVEEKIRGLQAIENDLKNHKLPGQTRALQAKIDALKASEAARLSALQQTVRDKKAQVVIQNQIDAVAKIDSKVIAREVRRVSRLYAIPI